MSRTRRTFISVTAAVGLLVASSLDPRWLGAAGAAATGGTAWLHLIGYAVLGAAVAAVVGPDRRGAAVAVGVATGYGAGVELLQLGLATRTGSLADAAVNGVGACLGVGGWWLSRRHRASSPDE
ncbi:VanZ family protein [Haloplanus pelagicus]|uniref:VanZ family protein n=1 Tax=Haloplanus pelagicus TaxID=2949995 RepID=UPI00203F4A49|nr:VanZ family protein [Haloplanus sp. HW8-1]